MVTNAYNDGAVVHGCAVLHTELVKTDLGLTQHAQSTEKMNSGIEPALPDTVSQSCPLVS